MESFEIEIKDKDLINKIFTNYYNNTSKIKYICNKELSSSICSICLNKLEFNEKREFKCGHMFHRECIDKWFKKTLSLKCPYCKQII